MKRCICSSEWLETKESIKEFAPLNCLMCLLASLLSSSAVSGFRGVCECELPNAALYTFSGALRMLRNDRQISLNAENLLLRGTKLRNTDFIVGGVVYAGSASKVQLNSLAVPSKRSHIGKIMERAAIISQ